MKYFDNLIIQLPKYRIDLGQETHFRPKDMLRDRAGCFGWKNFRNLQKCNRVCLDDFTLNFTVIQHRFHLLPHSALLILLLSYVLPSHTEAKHKGSHAKGSHYIESLVDGV